MSFRTEQDQFDKIKWFDSMREGRDLCGSYEFCADCDKSQDYPCAFAFEKHGEKKSVKAAKPAAKKTAAKKPAAKKSK